MKHREERSEKAPCTVALSSHLSVKFSSLQPMGQSHLETISTFIFKITVFKWQLLPDEESGDQKTLNTATQEVALDIRRWHCFLSQGEETRYSNKTVLSAGVEPRPGALRVIPCRCLLAGQRLLTQAVAWSVQTRSTTPVLSAAVDFANRRLGAPNKRAPKWLYELGETTGHRAMHVDGLKLALLFSMNEWFTNLYIKIEGGPS